MIRAVPLGAKGAMPVRVSQRDIIRIQGIEVDCVVGVYPKERDRLQPLHIDAELVLDSRRAATTERLGYTVDYEAVTAQVVFLLQSCRFQLLETAAHVISRHLLAPPIPGHNRPRVQELRLRLTKPGALNGRALPSLEITRSADEVMLVSETRGFGSVDIIHETRSAGIYRLNIAPGREIPLHVHHRMDESEMVLGTGLHCQGLPAERGSVRRWPKGAAHTYRNPGEQFESILCVDSPPFIEDDEILVNGRPAEVSPEPAWVGGA